VFSLAVFLVPFFPIRLPLSSSVGRYAQKRLRFSVPPFPPSSESPCCFLEDIDSSSAPFFPFKRSFDAPPILYGTSSKPSRSFDPPFSLYLSSSFLFLVSLIVTLRPLSPAAVPFAHFPLPFSNCFFLVSLPGGGKGFFFFFFFFFPARQDLSSPKAQDLHYLLIHLSFFPAGFLSWFLGKTPLEIIT